LSQGVQKVNAVHFDRPAKREGTGSASKGVRGNPRWRCGLTKLLDGGNASLLPAMKRRFDILHQVPPQLVQFRNRNEQALVVVESQAVEKKVGRTQARERGPDRFIHGAGVLDLDEGPGKGTNEISPGLWPGGAAQQSSRD